MATDLEEIRKIFREELDILKEDVIKPIKEGASERANQIQKLQQDVASVKADCAWFTWGMRVLYGSVITEGIGIIGLLLTN
jgi:hypothetical protein